MGTNKSSEQFEKWRKEQIASLIRTGHLEAAKAFEQLGSIHWMAWQSSRAVVEVELPKPIPDWGTDGWGDGYKLAIERCKESIEAQGLKVKA